MVFVELTPFVAFRAAHWTDEEFRVLQQFLLASPDAGNLIRGAGACENCGGRRAGAASVVARESSITGIGRRIEFI